MTNNEYSARFREIIQIFISYENFNPKSESYLSFIQFLCQSQHAGISEIPEQHFKSNIESLFNSVSHISDKTKRIRLYIIGLDLILNLGTDNSPESSVLQFNRIYQNFEDFQHLLALLLKFPGVLHADKEFGSTFDAYSKLANVIRKIYNNIDVHSVDNFEETVFSLLKQEQAINSIFILAVLSERYQSFRSKVIDLTKRNISMYSQSVNLMITEDRSKPQSEIPRYLLLALSSLACGYAFQYIQEGESESDNSDNPFSVDSLRKLILTLLDIKSFIFVPQCAIFFLCKLQNYLKPVKALNLFTQEIVTNIQRLFREKEPTTKLLFDLILSLPVTQESTTSTSMGPFTLNTQLTNLLPYMSFAIKEFENDYNDQLFKFVEKRKDNDLTKILEELASRDSTYKSAIVISVHEKLIDNTNNENTSLLKKLFPDSSFLFFDPLSKEAKLTPELIFQSIPYIASHGSITSTNVDLILNSIFGILSTELITQNRIEKSLIEELERCLSSLNPFINQIFINFVKQISNFTTAHGMSIICKFLYTNLNALPSGDFNVDFCHCVATLLRFILAPVTPDDFKTNYFKFIEMFSKQLGHTIPQINVDECQVNAYKFITTFVPQKLNLTLLNESYHLVEQKELSYSIICAAIPGIDEEHYNALLNQINKQLNPELFAMFYSTRAHISVSGTLQRLYDFTKSSQSGWFKKTPTVEFYKSVILAVTYLLEKNIIPDKEMEILMKTLEISIPKNVELLFKVRNEAKQMIYQMSIKHNAKPSKSFIEHLIGTPMYADSIPGLVSKIVIGDDQIKDAVQSWALHTFEDQLKRQKNAEFIESLFKYSNNPNTLNSIVSILINYMGSPYAESKSFETDPINAIELAASAAEIGRSQNIKYTDPSVVLLIKCSEYLLSPGDELRIATTRFLLNLYDLDLSDIKYDQPMSPNDIIGCFVSIFKLIIPLLKEEECLAIFDICVSSNPLQLHHVYLIRVLISVHSNSFVEHQAAPLIKLFTFKTSKMDATILSQIEHSILFFAQENVKAFTNFMCNLPLNELLTNCVNRLLMKTQLRNEFINEYAIVLSNARNFSHKVGLYQLLPILINYDLNNDCTGQLICCCLLLINLMFILKSTKNISFSSELKTISSIFSKLVNSNSPSGFFSNNNDIKSPFVNLVPVNFNINSTELFVESLNLAADQILNAVDVEQFDAFLETSMKINNSITTGLVLIHLLQRYSLYTSIESQKYLNKITEIVSTCFTNSKNIRILAFSLNLSINYEILKNISLSYQQNIFKCLLESSLNEQNTFMIQQTFELICWLVVNLERSVALDEIDQINQFAHIYFKLCSFDQNSGSVLVLNLSIINVLEFLANTNCQFVYKMGQSRLCYINLLMLMASYKQRVDVQNKICDVLKKLTSTQNDDEMLDTVLKTKIDQNEMKVLCGNLFKINTTNDGKFVDVRMLNDKYMELLWHVYKESYAFKEEVAPFHNEVFKIFASVVAVLGKSSAEELDEMHKNALDVATKALQKM